MSYKKLPKLMAAVDELSRIRAGVDDEVMKTAVETILRMSSQL